MNEFRIKTITADETLAIRHTVLWPDKPIAYCVVDGDETAAHFGLFVGAELVGVASTYEEDGAVRLRKCAVEEHHQGKGFGTALLEHAIRQARLDNASLFWCDARENAVPFYQQFGLGVDGTRFFKSGVPYCKMSIEL